MSCILQSITCYFAKDVIDKSFKFAFLQVFSVDNSPLCVSKIWIDVLPCVPHLSLLTLKLQDFWISVIKHELNMGIRTFMIS